MALQARLTCRNTAGRSSGGLPRKAFSTPAELRAQRLALAEEIELLAEHGAGVVLNPRAT